MVTYKIRVNRPCRLFIDDEEIAILEELKLAKFDLPEGEYLRKVVAIDNRSICDETKILLVGKSKLDDIVLDTAGLEEAKRCAMTNGIFKVGALYFTSSEDKLSVEVRCKKGDAYNFESINIPEQIVYSRYIYPVTRIGTSAFSKCNSLQSITIPESVENIGLGSFSSCSSLTSVTIPNSVKSIEDYAFLNCSNLRSISIPKNVEYIGSSAFAGCSLQKWITIPNSVKSIGAEAFVRTSFYEDESNWCDGILYINNCLIRVNEDFKGNFSIKAGTRLIADHAFENCSNLLAISIPNSVESIGPFIFSGCHSLTSITIPNSVKSIGIGAFCDCFSLASITIPNSVESIESCAFLNCNTLHFVVIPDSVTSIEDGVFEGCKLLTAIDYAGTKEQWKKIELNEWWNVNSNIQVVHCTDGDLAIN